MSDYQPFSYWHERGKEPAEKFSPQKIHFIRRVLELLSFDSCFEVGCGNGELTQIILEFIPKSRYIGCDISGPRIKMIKQRFEDLDIKQLDIRTISLSGFDLVICSHVLLHIPPSDIKKAMQNMLDSTEKYLVFFEPIHNVIPQPWDSHNFDHAYFDILYDLGHGATLYPFDRQTGLYVVRKH